MAYRSSWMTEELDLYRESFRRFLATTLPAEHRETPFRLILGWSPGGASGP